jgi:hypothetical protein
MKDRHAPVNSRTKYVLGAEQRGERQVNIFCRIVLPTSTRTHKTASQMRGRSGRIRRVLQSPLKLQ